MYINDMLLTLDLDTGDGLCEWILPGDSTTCALVYSLNQTGYLVQCDHGVMIAYAGAEKRSRYGTYAIRYYRRTPQHAIAVMGHVAK